MSVLPAGSKAQFAFFGSVVVEGICALLAMFWAPLGSPIIKFVLKELFINAVGTGAINLTTALAYARMFAVDHAAFEKMSIEFAIMDKQNASLAEIEEKLNAQQNALAKFVRRGNVG